MKQLLGFIFFTVFLNFSAISQLSEYADSLILVEKRQIITNEKVDLCNELCWELKSDSFQLALKYGQKAVKLSKELQYKEGSALAFKNLGGIYYIKSEYTTSLNYYDSSLVFYKKLNDKSGISKITRNMGSIMHQQGNYDKAVEYFIYSLTLRNELGDEKGKADIYNAMALVYTEQGEMMHPKALENYRKALKVFINLNNIKGQAETYYQIGSLFLNKEKPMLNSASFYYEKFLKLANELNDNSLMAQAYEGLGVIKKGEKQYKEAEEFFLKSEIILLQLDKKFSLASVYNNLSDLYLVEEKYKKALLYANKANELADEYEIPSIAMLTDFSLMKVYQKLNNDKLALKYAQSYINLNDSLSNLEMKEAIARMEVKYELREQKQVQKQVQERIEIEHKAEIKQQKTIMFFILSALMLMAGIALVTLKNYNQKRKANLLLEQKNREIEAKKNEIEAQQKHITDSIVYAKKIQTALLPPDEMMRSLLPESFVVFLPRDIVSGDFFWATQKDHLTIVTVADCTGHGVPGAFMSMLGVAFLTEIINKFKTENLTAGLVLTELRKFVKSSLRQTGKDDEAKDGMDIALCIIDPEKKIIHFSGANNSLIQIRSNELFSYQADRMPIGIHLKEKPEFTNHIIPYQPNDIYYLFSDGITDQFGGLEGKKYMSKRFKNELLTTSQSNIATQKEIILNNFKNWTNAPDLPEKYQQVDDICVIGFKM